jgi:phosphopantothenoylcysteine decarboxylase/phosphopantothenate--cysteine ligase
MIDPGKFRLIVTSGPTREWIDPVRFISNPSSGKTGHFIAQHGIRMFKEVLYICGPVSDAYRRVLNAENLLVETTDDMYTAVRSQIGPDTLLIMAAAPADFRPDRYEKSKIKKEERERMSIDLVTCPDILYSIRDARHTNFYRVGFAAETDNIYGNAKAKLLRKNLDMICANQVEGERIGFGSDTNTLFVIDRAGNETVLGPLSKNDLAAALLNHLVESL